MTARIGIDLGGTKIEAVALDPDRVELVRTRVPTPAGDYPGILAAIAGLVEEVEAQVSDTHPTVGVGHPGAISPFTGVLKNSNSVVLNGKPLHRDLAAALGRPVRLRNDADCFALSEATDGAAAGASTVFGVILGTGVGGGVVVRGRLLEGPNAIAGEWGHIPLPWPRPEEMPGPDCYCGKRGCVEKFLSGPGFSADHQRVTGEQLDAREIVQRASEGDAAAAATLERYVDRLARGLAVVIDILDPQVVVLGGGMSNVDTLYRRVPQVWDRYIFGGEASTRLVRNHHGDSSGVRGAAALVE